VRKMDGVPEAVVESIVDEIERVLPQVIVNIDVSDSTLKKLEAKERFRMQRAKKEFRHPSATYQRKVDAIKHIREAQLRILSESDSFLQPETFNLLADYNAANGYTLSEVNFPHHPVGLLPGADLEIGLEGGDATGISRESGESIIDIDEDLRRRFRRDRVLREVLESINLPFKRVITENDLGIKVKVYAKTDVEDEKWEKIYYHVDLGDLEYEEKMRLWDTIDDFIRNKIEELKRDRRYRLGSSAKRLEEINRNLYVLVNL